MGGFGVNPVLSGLVQAFSMANVMKNQQMQQEQLQLQKNRDQRQEEHEKFNEQRQTTADQQGALNSGAQPLDLAGQFSQQQSVPSSVPGMPATPFTMGGIPGDPGRMATIGGKKYQLANRQEQDQAAFDQKIKEGTALADINGQAARATNRAKLDDEARDRLIQLPGYTTPIDSRAVPFLSELKRAETTKADNINTRKSIGEEGDKNRAKDLQVAAMRERGQLTANAQGVQSRFLERQQDQANKANEADQIKEQELWKQFTQAKADLEAGKTTDKNGVEVNLTESTTKWKRAEAESYNKKIQTLQQNQMRRTKKFGGTYSNGSETPAASGGQLPQGGGKTIDQATGAQFFNAAGGDPVKARALAAAAGWKVQ
jgi:hypothetical protein